MDFILSQLATHNGIVDSWLDKILNRRYHSPTLTNAIFHRASLDDHSGVDCGDKLNRLI
jgi:hypothetical protein